MDTYRLKLKIGEHEFEAEGPVEVVRSQFEAFKELVSSLPRNTANDTPRTEAQTQLDIPASASDNTLSLDKITRMDDRIISLTAHPDNVEDALLLLLLGQRTFRGNDAVTGSELIGGLRQSGFTVARVDWRLERLARDGMIIKIGSGRASRYRLTNQGMNKAQGTARSLISLVP